MSDASPPKPLDFRVTSLRVVVIALALAAAGFLVYAFAQKPQFVWSTEKTETHPAITVSALTWIGMIGGGLLLVGFLVVPGVILGARLGRMVRTGVSDAQMNNPGFWLNMYMTQKLLGWALLAGAIVLFGVAYMQEGIIWLLIGGAVCVVFMAFQFPNRERVNQWIQEQWEWVQQNRQPNS